MAGTAGILAAALSALGGVAGAVGKGGHGPGSSGNLAGGRPAGGGMAPYTPSAAGFGSGGAGAPQGADLRLSQILGQQPQRSPEDEMRLSMMMGGYG